MKTKRNILIIVVLFAGLLPLIIKSNKDRMNTKPIEGKDKIFQENKPASCIKELDNNSPLPELFNCINRNISYHIFYPSYTPENLPLDRATILIQKKNDNGIHPDTVTYFLGDSVDKTKPSVFIHQQIGVQNIETNTYWKRLNKLELKKKIIINNNVGYIGTITDLDTGKIQTNLIFPYRDNTVFWFSTKYDGKAYDFDELVKIAESMQ